MVDIHSHILPGIDDGAKAIEDSIELCRIAAADGIRTIVSTPHVMEFRFPNRRTTIEPPYARLSAEVQEKGIPIRVVPGAEVHVAADLIKRYKDGDLVTYDDNGRYMLLEFPFQPIISGTEDVVYRLRLAGVTPVLAHPERIEFFMDDPDRLLALVRLGALAQVTAGSLLGSFGDRSDRAAWKMVDRGLVHVVASDAHDTRHRRPAMSDAAELLSRRAGPEAARRMCEEVPAAIVEGRDIELPDPEPSPRGFKGLLNRIFSRS
jgi:protein-tyrosine phosphatase